MPPPPCLEPELTKQYQLKLLTSNFSELLLENPEYPFQSNVTNSSSCTRSATNFTFLKHHRMQNLGYFSYRCETPHQIQLTTNPDYLKLLMRWLWIQYSNKTLWWLIRHPQLLPQSSYSVSSTINPLSSSFPPPFSLNFPLSFS